MKAVRAETPISFIRSIVRAYARYGRDPSAALRTAGIAPSLLGRDDARVTAQQMETFSGLAMRELDDEALGWFTRPLRWGSNGMLCRASLPSPHLRIALTRWCRHFGLLSDDIVLALTVEGGEAQLSVDEHTDLGEQRELCLVSTLRNLHGVACWMIDSRIPVVRATFPYAEPRHASAYGVMFPGAVCFAADRARLTFDAAYLKLPVRRDDRDLRTMLERPLPLIVRQYRHDRLLSQRIRELLRVQNGELSNASAVAKALNLSTRSLYRHLADEATSLQKLKDEVRSEIALSQLARTHRPLKQVAAAAGFRNETSFNRAFRGWTGQSPGEYRQSIARSE